MNKSEFIKLLEEKSERNENDCLIVSEILERHFIIGKKNKEKIINELQEKLSVSFNVANELYNIISKIIINGIKESLIHPFKSKN
ncbi:MAG: hypothetical protein ACLTAK_05800 [Bacilli bacterium]